MLPFQCRLLRVDSCTPSRRQRLVSVLLSVTTTVLVTPVTVAATVALVTVVAGADTVDSVTIVAFTAARAMMAAVTAAPVLTVRSRRLTAGAAHGASVDILDVPVSKTVELSDTPGAQLSATSGKPHRSSPVNDDKGLYHGIGHLSMATNARLLSMLATRGVIDRRKVPWWLGAAGSRHYPFWGQEETPFPPTLDYIHTRETNHNPPKPPHLAHCSASDVEVSRSHKTPMRSEHARLWKDPAGVEFYELLNGETFEPI